MKTISDVILEKACKRLSAIIEENESRPSDSRTHREIMKKYRAAKLRAAKAGLRAIPADFIQ